MNQGKPRKRKCAVVCTERVDQISWNLRYTCFVAIYLRGRECLRIGKFYINYCYKYLYYNDWFICIDSKSVIEFLYYDKIYIQYRKFYGIFIYFFFFLEISKLNFYPNFSKIIFPDYRKNLFNWKYTHTHTYINEFRYGEIERKFVMVFESRWNSMLLFDSWTVTIPTV